METGDKPFVIGLLSPVIYADLDGGNEYLILVTSVQSHSSEEIALDLEITIQSPDREPVMIERTRTIPADFDGDGRKLRNEPWKTWIPLPLKIPDCVEGTKVLAEVKGEGIYAWASVLFVQAPEED
ncbi:hypothetical protein [Sphingobium yanoikuyae]|uniref:hypothetical protein n=1 Tax=Sphingobium yanoikuyae TaxID=13690 RepID=UPI00240EF72D|nr:hypothetical protein [Sphingobium yanoikuyae]